MNSSGKTGSQNRTRVCIVLGFVNCWKLNVYWQSFSRRPSGARDLVVWSMVHVCLSIKNRTLVVPLREFMQDIWGNSR